MCCQSHPPRPDKHPAVPSDWRGVFLSLMVAALLALLLAVGLALQSCGGTTSGPSCTFPDDLIYSADRDSLGLDAFLALPAAEQAERRRDAETWRRRAKGVDRCDQKMQARRNVAGLAPDQAENWLILAEMMRWIGDHEVARHYLDQAAASLRFAPADQRSRLHLGICLTHAWLSYEGGEWRRGLAWADSAAANSPEDEGTLVIQGLLLAGAGQYRYAEDVAHQLELKDTFSNSARWIMGLSEWYRGNRSEGRQYFSGLGDQPLGYQPRQGDRAHISAAIRPEARHRAEAWRDLAALEEAMGGYSEARRRYGRSAAAVPCDDATCLTETEYRLLRPVGQKNELPIWLAFDRYYVTGSRSAYAQLVLNRFNAATVLTERQFWAEAAVNATGICIRRDMDKEYALRERGIIFVKLEMYDRARGDLRRARRLFERRQLRDDYRTLAWLGHLNIQEELYAAAVPQLQRAVELNPSAARAWSDLGLALIKTGDTESARVALDEAIKRDPSRAVAWYNRGLMYFHAGQWSEAVADFERAIHLAPNNQEILQVLQRAKMMERRSQQDAG